MIYRIRKSDACVFPEEDFGLKTGWIIQVWNNCEWMDVTRPYRTEDEAAEVKRLLEK